MRAALQTARKKAGKTQKEMAQYLELTTRHYQKIEAGDNNSTLRIWDALEAFFEYKIPQRQLREQTTTK